MIGIYFICFFGFPFLAVFPVRRVAGKKVLLDQDDTDVWKGIAACLIILAHLIIPMKEELKGIGVALHIYRVTGGMGVLIFFFISGYGIYKAYADRKSLGVAFWQKRLSAVYVPSVVIQFLACLAIMWQDHNFSLQWLFFYSFLGAWFIVAIMIQYFIFYISWEISRGKKKRLVILSFLGSIAVAALFYIFDCNPRWYNGLFLFPFGMLAGYLEKKIIDVMPKKWATCLFVSGSAFILSGGVFTYGKGHYLGIDLCKVLAGICLSVFICALCARIRLCSDVMRYIGKRSLFYYLIHLNLLEVCEKIGISHIKIFYLVCILVPCMVEISYKICGGCNHRLKRL